MSKTTEKETLEGYILKLFLTGTFKNTFSMENLTQKRTQLGLFFQKSGRFFRFSKRAREVSYNDITDVPDNLTYLTSFRRF